MCTHRVTSALNIYTILYYIHPNVVSNTTYLWNGFIYLKNKIVSNKTLEIMYVHYDTLYTMRLLCMSYIVFAYYSL